MVNDFDPTALNKQLDAMRRKVGALTPIGHRISNMKERLKVYPTIADRDHKRRMEEEITKGVADLARLTVEP